MKVDIYSREAIEKLIASEFPANTAAISFYDPKSRRNVKDYAPVDYQGKCQHLFMIGAHDIDIEILSDYGLTYDTYMPEVEDLAAFILQAEKNGMDIICQCDYGQSRSAACAAAIKEFFEKCGIEIFADYRYYPNQMVFNKVLNALKTVSERQETVIFV